MKPEHVCRIARRALPLMNPAQRAEAEAIIAEMERTANAGASVQAAVAAFEADMRPVRDAIVSALMAGDIEAMRGLRALLPHLLADVNRQPALADVFAFHLGKSFLDGINTSPEDPT